MGREYEARKTAGNITDDSILKYDESCSTKSRTGNEPFKQRGDARKLKRQYEVRNKPKRMLPNS